MSSSKEVSYISDSPAFTIVKWVLFVCVDVGAVVFDRPRLNYFHAIEALGA